MEVINIHSESLALKNEWYHTNFVNYIDEEYRWLKVWWMQICSSITSLFEAIILKRIIFYTLKRLYTVMLYLDILLHKIYPKELAKTIDNEKCQIREFIGSSNLLLYQVNSFNSYKSSYFTERGEEESRDREKYWWYDKSF